jgi:hypothetical protein
MLEISDAARIDIQRLMFYHSNKFITKEDYMEKLGAILKPLNLTVEELPEGELKKLAIPERTEEEKLRAKYDLLLLLEKRKHEKEMNELREEFDQVKHDHGVKLKRVESLVLEQKREMVDHKNSDKKGGLLSKIFKKSKNPDNVQ